MSARQPVIAVVGAGRMGRGIAHVFAYAGCPVRLIDLKPRPPADAERLLAAAKEEIADNLANLAGLGVLAEDDAGPILERITVFPADDAGAALADATVAFEAVPETMEAKRDALARIGAAVDKDTIIASTTSTLPVDDLAALVPGPGRFLNGHWLNPAHLIPLVEVSPGAATEDHVVQRFMAILEAAGKVPVRCAASPGYIVPRIQALAMNEAARMVEEGVATAEDIDKAIRVGFGPRYATMGFIEFIDWGGVDILDYASAHLSKTVSAERFAAPEVIGRLMAEGRKGMGRGGGFYDHGGAALADYRRQKVASFVALLRHMDLLPPPGGMAEPDAKPAGASGKGRRGSED